MLGFETGVFETRHGDYLISTDREKLDFAAIHRFLATESYWAQGMDPALLRRGIDNSLPFAAYDASGALAGFCRVVTDGTLFAYLRDVFVLARHRGTGLGRAITRAALDHPDLAGMKNWTLATRDAHGVYAALGFRPVPDPTMYMQKKETP
ncbi:N-acetyltransferase [Rhodovarius crocodyli]|uniref:N-acetyltransferase n=1 Tax=Rhodovarius crocodyli TaxID=1979269 RepID=A0A437M3P7_9PROT|nr:GNAT family N-acetyltransferase [Rhodovarius crocodyli]RVT92216.1 N-acetyltransferase [Rhodovarius crocodyli]